MNLKSPNNRISIINLFADYIIKSIPSDEDSIIQIADCVNFYTIKGITSYNIPLDISKLSDEFCEKFSLKSLNTIDLIEYNKKFDMYLYEEVGYPILNTLTVGLYCSPYGATSIREYFANGFEFFFLKDRELVKQVSPQLYKKLLEIEKGSFFNNVDEITDDLSY